MAGEGEYEVDLGLIQSISLPSDGKIPGALTSIAGQEHYDAYFRLVRQRPDLATWTQSCLDVQRDVLVDLERSSLSDEDKVAILAGCVVTLHSTLAEWVAHAHDDFGEAAA
ncbi:hypothetical protein SAMN05421504_103533 [Amycolatopsis xylanica]|uniref:Uncharacterized protein n=1 Tax=Amycolatopsis xylanica TaxID=589385 RepID=A0A1H3DWV8_9PSEU|nr:hypothetical protein [Amycolatopsis xylanica]SDX70099.1 hypothetical protein SAMN05421504_103533 [Amycolatopsis xylanica]